MGLFLAAGEREGAVPPHALTGEEKRENPPSAVSAKGGWREGAGGGLVFELGIEASLVATVLAATNEGGEDEDGDNTDGGAEEVRGGAVAVGRRVGVIGNAGEHDYKRDEVDSDSRPIAANNWGGHALALSLIHI